jgi:hypothetical protein
MENGQLEDREEKGSTIFRWIFCKKVVRMGGG